MTCVRLCAFTCVHVVSYIHESLSAAEIGSLCAYLNRDTKAVADPIDGRIFPPLKLGRGSRVRHKAFAPPEAAQRFYDSEYNRYRQIRTDSTNRCCSAGLVGTVCKGVSTDPPTFVFLFVTTVVLITTNGGALGYTTTVQ